MNIKKVAVLGAGAVGSYVIWGLSKRDDISLGVVAEGERAERLKKGCIINDITYKPEVWTPQEAHGADLLIVSLKYGALPDALDSIAAVTADNTTVMSLMNGVDSEEIIAAKIGAHFFLTPNKIIAVMVNAGNKKVSAPNTTRQRILAAPPIKAGLCSLVSLH